MLEFIFFALLIVVALIVVWMTSVFTYAVVREIKRLTKGNE